VSFRGTVFGAAVTVQGGVGPDTFTINPTATVPTLSISGLSGSDTFQITPSPTTSFALLADRRPRTRATH